MLLRGIGFGGSFLILGVFCLCLVWGFFGFFCLFFFLCFVGLWVGFCFFLVECVVCGGDCGVDWWGNLNRLAIIQTAGCFCIWRLEINANMQVRI